MNGLLLQAFSWYEPDDGSHWRRVESSAQRWAQLGVTACWLPPAFKGDGGPTDVGYGVYDLFDLGEFDQKGSVRTKYGTKDEYIRAVGALHEAGIQVLADAVFNHRMGADGTEEVLATPVDSNNRTNTLGPAETIEAWTRFNFPGRRGAYSDFTWDWTCFHGTDFDEASGRKGLWLFDGKEWSPQVDSEFGNFDYLMGDDVDLRDTRVVDELIRWGRWTLDEVGVDGFRMDALKHMGRDFTMSWIRRLREETGRELFTVGEYWSGDLGELRAFIGGDRMLSLFDVPLHFSFHNAAAGPYDLRQILNGSLVESDPTLAVTFVENHDTQEGQSLQSPIAPWFKPAAYALVLLRDTGYPCVFLPDLEGCAGEHPIDAVAGLDTLMRVRRSHALGIQRDAFLDPTLIAWTREGAQDDPLTGLAAVVSTQAGQAHLEVGGIHAGQRFECVIGDLGPVDIAEDGWGDFPAAEGGLVVYVPEGSRP